MAQQNADGNLDPEDPEYADLPDAHEPVGRGADGDRDARQELKDTGEYTSTRAPDDPPAMSP